MYNVWEWNIWVLVTIAGWAMLVKGVAYFLLPANLIKMAFSWKGSFLYAGGIFATIMGGVLSYYTYLV